jgi:hypothetical protein
MRLKIKLVDKMRDSFVFYRSFFEAVEELPPDEFKRAILAIAKYALNDEVPQTKGIERTIYIMAKPQIDTNNQKYINGKKGGRPKNQTITNVKPNNNQSVTNTKPNVNDNVNGNVNDNVIFKENITTKEKPANGKQIITSTSSKRFIKPAEEDIEKYCTDAGIAIDVKSFFDFYESKGWVVGTSAMKDWKAAVRNWARRERSTASATSNDTASKTLSKYDRDD